MVWVEMNCNLKEIPGFVKFFPRVFEKSQKPYYGLFSLGVAGTFRVQGKALSFHFTTAVTQIRRDSHDISPLIKQS